MNALYEPFDTFDTEHSQWCPRGGWMPQGSHAVCDCGAEDWHRVQLAERSVVSAAVAFMEGRDSLVGLKEAVRALTLLRKVQKNRDWKQWKMTRRDGKRRYKYLF